MESDEIVFVEHPPSMPILSSSRPLPYPRPDDKQANLNPYQQGARSVVGMTSSPIEQGSCERNLPSIPIEKDMKEPTTEFGSSRQRQDSDWSLGSESQSEDMTEHEERSLGELDAGQAAPFPPPPPPPPPPPVDCHFGPGGYNSQIPHPVSFETIPENENLI